MYVIRQARRLFALCLLFGVTLAAIAGSVHFVGGVSFTRGSLQAFGDIAGVGNANITARLDAYATVLALCENPGGNTAPGRNPIRATTLSTGYFESDKNGRISLALRAPDPLTTTPPPPSPSPKTAGCPNGNWTVSGFVPGSTRWTNATITLFDNANGAVLMQKFYVCNDDGVSSNIACTEV